MEGVSAEMIRNAHQNPWVFFTSRATGITFPIGLIMLSIGLYKNKTISLPLLIGLVVSIILFPIERIPKELIFNVAGDALMIVSFKMVGKAYRRKTN